LKNRVVIKPLAGLLLTVISAGELKVEGLGVSGAFLIVDWLQAVEG
jgi:hypothetical protein